MRMWVGKRNFEEWLGIYKQNANVGYNDNKGSLRYVVNIVD